MIDLYCERTAAGLWNEPANVVSNAAFAIVALLIWRIGREPGAPRGLVRLLAGLALAVAVGSTLFHMLATPAARVMDEGPILVFQIVFLWLYGTRVQRLAPTAALLMILGLVAATALLRRLAAGLNGSIPYVPALILTFVLGVDHLRANRRHRMSLLAGSLLFVLAITCRSIDNAVCASFPHGTHFLWHVLAAVVLFLFARGLVVNADDAPRSRTS